MEMETKVKPAVICESDFDPIPEIYEFDTRWEARAFFKDCVRHGMKEESDDEKRPRDYDGHTLTDCMEYEEARFADRKIYIGTVNACKIKKQKTS